MNLTKIVRDKIKKLGATKAAAYFGVSVPTIYSWKKKNPPVEAAQMVLNEQHDISSDPDPIQDGPAPVPVTTSAPLISPTVHEDNPLFSGLDGRLKKIEKYLEKLTQKDIPITSGIQPFKNFESGITTVSKAEVIEGQPNRKPEAPFWNRPLRETPKEQGWNAPVTKIEGRNPGGDWNRPVKQEA